MKKTIKEIKKFRLTNTLREKFEKSNVIHVGLTTVSLLEDTAKILNVEHAGNMGNSIERSVNPNLNRIGLPTISELKDIYEVIDEQGSPDYYYSIEFDIHIYSPKNNKLYAD